VQPELWLRVLIAKIMRHIRPSHAHSHLGPPVSDSKKNIDSSCTCITNIASDVVDQHNKIGGINFEATLVFNDDIPAAVKRSYSDINTLISAEEMAVHVILYEYCLTLPFVLKFLRA
jgi:hypothetical protein